MAEDKLLQLKEMRLKDVYSRFANEENLEEFLLSSGLLVSERNCSKCGNPMTLSKGRNYSRWRCRRKYDKIQCNTELSVKTGSFFENSKLSFSKILELSYFWSTNHQDNEWLMRELEIGSFTTATDWKSFFRDVCWEYFTRNPIKIGGPNKIFEIDECVLVRRKKVNGKPVGRKLRYQWIFGGIERGSNKCFFEMVSKRDSGTLLAEIQKHILPGTTIMSDCWSGYNGIKDMEGFGYKHLTVNHSKQFVDPVSGACTNTIESIWQKLKHEHKKRFGTHRSMLSSYLREYMWRNLFKADAFFELWRQIRDYFPFQCANENSQETNEDEFDEIEEVEDGEEEVEEGEDSEEDGEDGEEAGEEDDLENISVKRLKAD